MGVVSFIGPLVHSTLVYGAMWVFFPETGYTPLDAVQSFATWEGIATNLITAGLVLLVWYFSRSRTWNQLITRIETVQNTHLGEHYHLLSLIFIIFLALLSSVAVAIYFVNRMELVLNQQGISLTDTEHADLLHLQIQFLIGILAMMALVIIFLIFNRRYTTYMNREAKTDALTGALNRKAFFQICGKELRGRNAYGGASGYFIMVDMDHFKEINDRYGHPEGDRVLKETARELEAVFGREGYIGRVGGDEFALLLGTPMPREDLERYLNHFFERLRKITWGDQQISCSIGVQPVTALKNVDDLYRGADSLLYMAKKQGKNRYVVGPVEAVDSVK